MSNVDPMMIVSAFIAAAGPQINSTPEGRAIVAAGLGDALARLVEKIARNAAGPTAMDIEEALGIIA